MATTTMITPTMPAFDDSVFSLITVSYRNKIK